MRYLLPLLLILGFFPVHLQGEIYRTVGDDYHPQGRTHELSNMPPVRSQDGVGLCYGFASTTLLDRYICQQKDKSCDNPKNEHLSALAVTGYSSYRGDKIKVGGQPIKILSNIKRLKERKIYSEKCAPFESLMKESNGVSSQAFGWNYLQRIFRRRHKMYPKEIKCHAIQIKETLPVENSLEDIIAAFDFYVFGEFVHNIIIPKSCRGNPYIEVPDFEVRAYPKHNEERSYEGIISHIEQALSNDIPVELSFCTNSRYEPSNVSSKCEGHAIVVTGMKEVCKGEDCRTLIKVHNSYGKSWQDKYNDGWVDAFPLVRTSALLQNSKSLSWIQSPNQKLKPIKSKRSTTAPSPSREKSSSNQAPMPDIDMSRKPIFKCDSGFGGQWIPNDNCELLKYRK